jgi:hypothetical protein
LAQIDWSGKDVVEKMDYYINHLDEAEKIARSARMTWDTFSKRDDNGKLPKQVSDKILSDFYNITGIKV